MAWIRLSDDYINHPKFTVLSAGAFRLWHEGLAYCRRAMTDGVITHTALRTFRYVSKPFTAELTNPVGKLAPLWESREDGYLVHDYLDWNAGHREEREDREAAKKRMRAYRGRSPDVTPDVTPCVTANVTPAVPGEGEGRRSSSEKDRVHKPASSLEFGAIADRAGHLVRNYDTWYGEERHGARHRSRPNLDWTEACELVKLWPDERLEKLARIVLSTDDSWISTTDRSFAIFAKKATWADDRLTAWEQAQKASA